MENQIKTHKSDKKLIAAKLRAFGDAKFNRIKDFAEALGMSDSALQSSYLNGRSIPGGEILAKLNKLGCDINWLLSDQVDYSNISTIMSGSNQNEPPVPYMSDKDRIKLLEDENQKLKLKIDETSKQLQTILSKIR